MNNGPESRSAPLTYSMSADDMPTLSGTMRDTPFFELTTARVPSSASKPSMSSASASLILSPDESSSLTRIG